jgi:FRG domain-containing protein
LVRRYRAHPPIEARPAIDEAGLRVVERELVERARATGLGGGLCELELLARLQHHGAATRLPDCIRNAFVALWFACRWEPNTDGVLIGFELGDNALHLDTAMLERDMDPLLATAAGRLLWWRPRNLSPRISAQQAVFVFGEVVQERWGSLRLAEGQVSLGGIGAIPGAAVIFISAQLKHALAGLWRPLLGSARRACSPTSTDSPKPTASTKTFHRTQQPRNPPPQPIATRARARDPPSPWRAGREAAPVSSSLGPESIAPDV